MKKIARLGMAALVSVVLAACGGGSDGGDETAPFGAIGISQSRQYAAIIFGNTQSRAQVNTLALEGCGGGDCHIALEFSGPGSCGAVAGSDNGVFGVAKANSLAAAQSEAIAACTRNQGKGCSVPSKLSVCQ